MRILLKLRNSDSVLAEQLLDDSEWEIAVLEVSHFWGPSPEAA